jgi:hypothetical protein
MNTNPDIQIIDVIVTYSQYAPERPHYSVIVDRSPLWIYAKEENRLTAHDSGFYDFLSISPGTTKAFGGREFNISLTDGTTYRCKGQVWACGSSTAEPVVYIGIGTIERLKECYVFSSAYLSKAKLDAWLATNKPSRNYHKYDPRYTVEWLDAIYAKYPPDRTVCAKRARKLRIRGATIRINQDTGKRGWSPSYERKKAEILKLQKLDQEEQS